MTSRFLIGYGNSKEGKAFYLKKQLDNYNDLLEQCNTMCLSHHLRLEKSNVTDVYADIYEDKKTPWAITHFDHSPAIVVFETLKAFKTKILVSENIIYKALIEKYQE